MLGSQGAFDNDYSYSGSSDYDDSDDSWKLFCEDGSEYGIDPDDFDTEEEYEEALTEAKYGWREECVDGLEYGVTPEDYETEEEYNEAIELAKSESEEVSGTDTNVITERLEAQVSDTISVPITLQVSTPKHDTLQESVNSYAARRDRYMWRKRYRRQNTYGLNIYDYETEREFLQALAIAKEEFLEVARNDKNIYLYCGVVYENNPHPYHYRTNDTTLKIGDKVIVPVGPQNKEEIAEIVSVEQHTRLTVPYPVEKVYESMKNNWRI